MIPKIISWSLKNRYIVLLIAAGLFVWGIFNIQKNPIDAIPDLSENQVIVFTEWMGRGPQIMEDQVTYPLVSNLQGIPNVKNIRGTSMFGMSFVYVIFEDDVDVYWARTRVLERLNYAQRLLPAGVTPALGPDGTGVGHIFWYTLDAKNLDLGEQRALQDWYIKLALQTVPGVAEVASFGGFEKQYQLVIDPVKLQFYNISLMDVMSKVKASNNDVGGRKFEMSDMAYIIRGLGYIKNKDDMESIALGNFNGIPVRVKDVGTVQMGGDLRLGIFDENGEGEVVDGVDLTIQRGRTLGVVGESGCGKSITSLSLLQLIAPPGRIESGEILFYKPVQHSGDNAMVDVVNITALNPRGREIRDIRGNHISMVFQEPMTAMIPVRTIGQQITEAIILHQGISKQAAREQAIDMLARVKMSRPERVIDDYPFQLSGGMRQRAVIAMALSCRPSLLIADEPTTALDVTTEAQILDLMRTLQNDFGMAIMYITHNMGVIAEMADEVAVMYMGKVVEQTDVKKLFLNPLHPYTRGLLASIPQLNETITQADRSRRLQTIKGMVPDPYKRLIGCPFAPRCPAAIPNVCDKIEPKNVMAESGHFVRCHLYTEASSS